MKKSSENKKHQLNVDLVHYLNSKAVERADKDGVAQVAKDLGITPGLIYNWRNSLANQSSEQEEIKLMRAENARLKRELSIAQDDLAF